MEITKTRILIEIILIIKIKLEKTMEITIIKEVVEENPFTKFNNCPDYLKKIKKEKKMKK